MRAAMVATGLLLAASSVHAQQKASANPATTGIQNIYAIAKGYILKAAQQVPEDKYAFQATKEVRTFGQILGHIADAQNLMCSTAVSKQPSSTSVEKTVTGKAGLIAALTASFAVCDAAYAATADAALSKPVTLFGQPATVSQTLTMNAAHNFEHYGNLVTYMRLLGMVPPSSQSGM